MNTTKNTFAQTLEQFFASPDFKEGVIASTKASWGGSGYSVELFEDGSWRVLWNNQIGNLYDSPGVILALPTINEEMGEMSEEDYFDNCFANEEEEFAQRMREEV